MHTFLLFEPFYLMLSITWCNFTAFFLWGVLRSLHHCSLRNLTLGRFHLFSWCLGFRGHLLFTGLLFTFAISQGALIMKWCLILWVFVKVFTVFSEFMKLAWNVDIVSWWTSVSFQSGISVLQLSSSLCLTLFSSQVHSVETFGNCCCVFAYTDYRKQRMARCSLHSSCSS